MRIKRVGSIQRGASLAGVAMVIGLAGSASAQAVVYRCPGPPVLYTDALSAKEAQEKGCRSIDGTPITVFSPIKPKAGTAAPAASGAPNERVDPKDQRSRDNERRRVLEQELREAEERLAKLQKEFNNGEPERQGNERNYQKYLDRVAELKASVARQESDIQAIKRELSKIPN
ncbi:hypothetical protein DES44_4253 [Roseateles depolymerans]|uniref:Putative signal peptide protein n=2 Tax=Roseateles depolymerans TaxID=76731 RepID=A0A0U3LLP7_9BURK|nr:Putative signal peptide protein [Roseateles depolymerans]REG12881.1 hypothetical protein DES44_4253 [Roseateles depolymerans]